MLVNVWGDVNTWDAGAPPGTLFTVDYANLNPDSPFAGVATYSAIVIGDSCVHDAVTTPGGNTVTMAGDGSFTLSTPVVGTQTFDFAIYDASDQTTGNTSTITAIPVPDGELNGTLTGSASVLFTLSTVAALSAVLAGGSSLQADLSTPAAGEELSALLAGTSTITADLAVGDGLQAAIIGGSTLAADLSVFHVEQLSANLAGTSSLAADLSAFPSEALNAVLAGGSTLAAALSTRAGLQAVLDGYSLLQAALASNVPPRIPITMDLSPFFNNSELSHDAMLNNTTPFLAIVTDWYDPIVGGTANMGATDPLVIADHSVIPDVTEGDTILIASFEYVVREVQPDNTGIVRLKCEVP